MARGDEARGDRRAVVVQDRHQPHRIDAAFVDDQRAQLGVAVLLDHEHEVVLVDEVGRRWVEREGADAQPVELGARAPRAMPIASSIAGAVEPK